MSTTRRTRPLLVALLGALLLIGLLAALPRTADASEAPRAHRAGGLLRLLSPTDQAISPDRSGDHRRARIRYRLAKRAVVSVRVTSAAAPHRVYDVHRLGRQDRGRHAFSWRGVQPGVGRLPDGGYVVEVRAHRVGRPAATGVTRSTEVTIDTSAPTLDLQVNRHVVYPQTTLFTDRILLALALEEDVAALDVSVLRWNGDLVRALRPETVPCDDARYDAAACLTASWDGTRTDGSLAPVGPYRLRLDLVDGVDNRSVIEETVKVSDLPLVERTTTWTSLATSPEHRAAICGVGDGNGCGESSCGPAVSQRFSMGLSFGACQSYTGPSLATAHFVDYSFSGGDTGHERFQVTAHGGPAADGSSAAAVLSAGGRQVTLTGDGSFTLPVVAVDAAPLDRGSRPTWKVEALTADAWDVAAFDISFTDFVPAS